MDAIKVLDIQDFDYIHISPKQIITHSTKKIDRKKYPKKPTVESLKHYKPSSHVCFKVHFHFIFYLAFKLF